MTEPQKVRLAAVAAVPGAGRVGGGKRPDRASVEPLRPALEWSIRFALQSSLPGPLRRVPLGIVCWYVQRRLRHGA